MAELAPRPGGLRPGGLRPYQTEARRRIHAEWDAGHRRTLLVLPTGTGKTVVFAAVAEDCVRAGQRVLVQPGQPPTHHGGERPDSGAGKAAGPLWP